MTEATDQPLFHMVILVKNDAGIYGEEALGHHLSLDLEMRNIGWRLPDAFDSLLKPGLVAFSHCGSAQDGKILVQRMVEWLAAHPVAFYAGNFEVYAYGTVPDVLVYARAWKHGDVLTRAESVSIKAPPSNVVEMSKYLARRSVSLVAR